MLSLYETTRFRQREKKKEWMLEVNKQYQEVIKIVINLVTASLVLPVVFVHNILGVKTGDPNFHLGPLAYWSWVLLGISLLACVLFYVCSTKFTKAVYKNEETTQTFMKVRVENWRDTMGISAALFFLVGLVCLFLFFYSELSGAKVTHVPVTNFDWRGQ